MILSASSISETIDETELLLRAVFPANKRPDFWYNGRLSSAALKDKRGLSVERTYDRTLENAAQSLSDRFTGSIISLSMYQCKKVHASVKYCPSLNNPYHCEIHGSDTEIPLSDTQALILARKASIVKP